MTKGMVRRSTDQPDSMDRSVILTARQLHHAKRTADAPTDPHPTDDLILAAIGYAPVKQT
ncbi:hypothetical protein ACIG87_19390 [Micromonospora sp. NPDC051925]|uniref:hypothetical protein n=1 Tax=Micromonospora sp. NPDC051925 TaxID=3364288 RepID=UPI0037C6C3CD